MLSNNEAWILTYADDQDILTSGPHMIDNCVLVVFVLVLFNVPISWKKSAGGFEYEWIGFAQDLSHFKLGISVRRAAWITRWITDTLEHGKVQPKSLSEVLGRFNFAAAAIDVTKPFLAPIYTWVAAAPSYAYLPLPVLIRLIFKFLVKVYSDPSLFMIDAREPIISPEVAFKGDAHAAGDDVGVGGWQADRTPAEAAWFSCSLDRTNARGRTHQMSHTGRLHL